MGILSRSGYIADDTPEIKKELTDKDFVWLKLKI
jgi:hypothetical protein